MERVDDDHARQPGRIEDAFLQIELPGAALLRHQLPLQASWQAAPPCPARGASCLSR